MALKPISFTHSHLHLQLISSNPKPNSKSKPPHSSKHCFNHFSLAQISLKTIPNSLSQSQNPIFLPYLQQQQRNDDDENERSSNDENDSNEAKDPFLKFFKSKKPIKDPLYEGRTMLQRNRRSTWRLSDSKLNPSWNEAENESFEVNGSVENESEVLGVSNVNVSESVEYEILKLARGLSENETLGEVLSGYEGKISGEECVEVLRLMGEEGLVMSCLHFCEWMRVQEEEGGGEGEVSFVSWRTYMVMFGVLGKARMGEELMILFKNMPRTREFRDVGVYNAAISGLSSCGRFEDSWKVYQAMEMNNIRPDHVTGSILITIMRKSGGSAKDAWEFFRRLNRKGVNWRLEVLGALIKSFCDEGLHKEALIIQSEMEKRGIPSNVIVYNTLMDAYSKADQIEEVEGLFKEMKDKGLKPTSATYNILMDAYSRRMEPDIIEDLLSEMQKLGVEADIKSYTCLISAYGRKRKMSDMASNTFLSMKKAGIKADCHSYTALIHAYSVDGWHEKAYITFEAMIQEGIKPSVHTYTALLDAFRRIGDTQMLMEIWKSMRRDKIEGTRVTFNTLLDGFAKQGQYSDARDVVSEFGRIGLQPTVLTYNMLMNAYARGGQHSKLPQLYKEMTTLNLKPDSATYSTMIYAYVRVRDFSRAFYYHKQMVRNKQVPDQRSYEKLRAILDVKAATKNRKDKSAILGIINSSIGLLKPKKRGKKDEFWKNKKKWTRPNSSFNGRHI